MERGKRRRRKRSIKRWIDREDKRSAKRRNEENWVKGIVGKYVRGGEGNTVWRGREFEYKDMDG